MGIYKQIKNISLEDDLLAQTSEIFKNLCVHFNLESVMLAKKEKNGEYFEQFLAIGLEEDFYYDFLSRDKPYLEKILEKDDTFVFKNSDFSLHSKNAKFAYAKRLFQDDLKGFFVIESQEELNPYFELLLQNIADSFLDNSNNNAEDYLGIFLESIFFEKHFLNKTLFSISGNMSLLKVKIVEFIKKKWKRKGQIIYISEFSSNEIQFKEQLKNWLHLSKEGLLVIENSDLLSEEQIEILRNSIELANPVGNILFLFNSSKINRNDSKFFQDMQKSCFPFPDIFELEKKPLEMLIRATAQIFGNSSEMNSNDLEFFLRYEYKNGLPELIHLVEEKYKGIEKQVSAYDENLNLRDSIMNLERSRILAAKKRFKGNQIKMAKALGISRGSLQYKIKQLKIE